MIRRIPVLAAAFLTVSAFAQYSTTSRYGSTSGFGSVLYPGVGHAPNMVLLPPPSFYSANSFATRVGSTVRGGYYGGVGYGGVAHGVAHPPHSRQVIVPVPIVVGGGYYPYDQGAAGYYQEPAATQQQPAPPPVVVINQNYRPETAQPAMQDYTDTEPPPSDSLRRYDSPVHPMPDPKDLEQPARRTRIRTADEQATIYLIAFKDHTILPALAYWVEDETLNYITSEGTLNHASMTLIDRDFSRQLNRERQVEFSLP
jgi:hypothetical protein